MEQQTIIIPDQCFSQNTNKEAFETSQLLENLIFNVSAIKIENQCLMKQFQDYCIKNLENTDINVNYLKTASINMIAYLKSIIEQVKTVQTNVLSNHLVAWKMNQKYVANGAVIKSSVTLNVIQMWCEMLANSLWTLQELLQNMINYFQIFPITDLMSIDSLCELAQTVANLLEILIVGSFVVERQPPQVILTNKKFTTTVRFLIGNELNMNMSSPNVTVKLVSEELAERIQETNHCTESCGEIMNDKGVMDYNESTKQLSLTFNNLQLNISKTDRRRKCPNEKVVDKKFALLFQLTIPVRNTNQMYSIWGFSLPVVIIVNANQESNAWATIFWDNAFSDFNRKPFVVPEKVSWNRLGQALSMKFDSIAGRQLTSNNLQFLLEKLLRIKASVPLNENCEITWTQFSKENIPGCNFTFWDWFFDVMKLTRMHLKALWGDGLIIGFINRKLAEQYLSCCQRGTFLLRFSETELGSITISMFHKEYDILHLQPFSIDDLKMRSLADCIRDFDWISYLYPNYPKAEVFGKYMSVRETAIKPKYVPRGIRALILQDDNLCDNKA